MKKNVVSIRIDFIGDKLWEFIADFHSLFPFGMNKADLNDVQKFLGLINRYNYLSKYMENEWLDSNDSLVEKDLARIYSYIENHKPLFEIKDGVYRLTAFAVESINSGKKEEFLKIAYKNNIRLLIPVFNELKYLLQEELLYFVDKELTKEEVKNRLEDIKNLRLKHFQTDILDFTDISKTEFADYIKALHTIVLNKKNETPGMVRKNPHRKINSERNCRNRIMSVLTNLEEIQISYPRLKIKNKSPEADKRLKGMKILRIADAAGLEKEMGKNEVDHVDGAIGEAYDVIPPKMEAKEESFSEIKNRPFQQNIREYLMAQRGNRCEFCQTEMEPEHLRAAHIKPFAMSSEEEKINIKNFLLLGVSCGCDTNFELHFLLVDPSKGAFLDSGKAKTAHTRNQIQKLAGQKCPSFGEENKYFFEAKFNLFT